MKRLMMILAVLALVFVAVGNMPTSQAQDGGLTEEQLALVERLYNATQKVDTYDSYVLQLTELQSQDLTASIAGFDMSQTSSQEIEYTQTVTLGGDNVLMVATVSLDEAELGAQGSNALSFSAQVEGRLVDGVIYVNAQYLEGDGDLPELPEGWVELDNLGFDALELLTDLDLEDLIDDPEDKTGPLEDLDQLKAIINAIEVTTETLEDGTEVDVLTATFGSEGLMSLLAESGEMDLEDPTTVALMGMMGDNFNVTIQVKLDAEDNPRYAMFEMTIELVDLDMASLGIEGMPPGGSMSMTMANQEIRQWSNINDPALQPVEAPTVE